MAQFSFAQRRSETKSTPGKYQPAPPKKHTNVLSKRYARARNPLEQGVNAKGITLATAWLISRENPHVICTTVPCTERNLNGGEWTFMTPLNIPLPDAKKHHAFHCFLQLQNGNDHAHLHIVGAAVSPQNNMVPFLTGKGKICLIRLMPRINGGGLRSYDEELPIELDLTLGDVDEMRGDIRFSDDGTRLHAVTWKSSIEIVFSGDNQHPLFSARNTMYPAVCAGTSGSTSSWLFKGWEKFAGKYL